MTTPHTHAQQMYSPENPDANDFFRTYHALSRHPLYLKHSMQAQRVNQLENRVHDLEHKLLELNRRLKDFSYASHDRIKSSEKSIQHLMRKVYNRHG